MCFDLAWCEAWALGAWVVLDCYLGYFALFFSQDEARAPFDNACDSRVFVPRQGSEARRVGPNSFVLIPCQLDIANAVRLAALADDHHRVDLFGDLSDVLVDFS